MTLRRPAKEPRPAMPIHFSNKSDHGRREANEDAFGAFLKGGRHLFVVADGMGGEAGGRIASTTVVAACRRVFEADPGGAPPDLLRRCVSAASDACGEKQAADPTLASMGSTLELLLVDGQDAWIAHVGDSRIYRVSNGKTEKVTRDHTRVQQMLDDGLLTAEEAAEHPQRNVLSRVVGRREECIPDVSTSPLPFAEGDSFVLCSDGLTDVVTDGEIAAIVSDAHPEQACKHLVQLALKKNTADNVTVQVVYRGLPKSSWKRRRTLVSLVGEGGASSDRRRWWWVAAVIAVCLVAVGFALGRWWPREGNSMQSSSSLAASLSPSPTATKDPADQQSLGGADSQVSVSTSSKASGTTSGVASPPATGTVTAAQSAANAKTEVDVLKAQIQDNEARTIEDLKGVLSAEAAYHKSAGGSFGSMKCLVKPQERNCLKDYPRSAQAFLSEPLARDRSGYQREFNLASDSQTFSIVATPASRGVSGLRSFCADDSQRICVYEAGRSPRLVGGRCEEGCKTLAEDIK